MLVHFLEIRRTRKYLSDATAVAVVTSSGDESFEFSSTYTFLFNSSSNYSLIWRHIVMNLQHPVYYCFVNNIIKHEGDTLHICDDIVVWFWWLSATGVKQFAFHWSISSAPVQKQRVFNSLIIHHLIMITCISYGNISAIFVPKCINIPHSKPQYSEYSVWWNLELGLHRFKVKQY